MWGFFGKLKRVLVSILEVLHGTVSDAEEVFWAKLFLVQVLLFIEFSKLKPKSPFVIIKPGTNDDHLSLKKVP